MAPHVKQQAVRSSHPGAQSYQEQLRAMGAQLDQDQAGRVSIVEVSDGFLLRRQRFRHTSVDLAISHLTYDELEERARQLREIRPRPRRMRHPGLWSSFSGSHQDFFRALGYELDAVGARHLLVDELSDGLLVCYVQATTGDAPEMRRVVLSTGDIEQILNEAVKRRRTLGDRRIFQQVGTGVTESSGRPAERQSLAWAPVRDGLPYQRLLRTVGAALDQRGAAQVCLLEAPDAMVGRYQAGDGRLHWVRFPHEQLQVDGPARQQHRSVLRRRVPTTSCSYQDLFRALGYELEREHASGILLSEQDDALTVTYQYLDASRSLTAVKAMVVLDHQKQDTLVQQARSRRQPDTRLLVRLTRRQHHPSPRASWDVLKQGTG